MNLRPIMVVGAALVALSAPLAGCGKLGRRETPGPLNGARSPAAARPAGRTQDSEPAVGTVDARDRAADPATSGEPASDPR